MTDRPTEGPDPRDIARRLRSWASAGKPPLYMQPDGSWKSLALEAAEAIEQVFGPYAPPVKGKAIGQFFKDFAEQVGPLDLEAIERVRGDD